MERYFLFVFFFSCPWQNSRFLPLGCCSLIFYQISIKRFFKSANQHGLTEPGCDSLSSTRPHVNLKVDDTQMPPLMKSPGSETPRGPKEDPVSLQGHSSEHQGRPDLCLSGKCPSRSKFSLKSGGGGKTVKKLHPWGWNKKLCDPITTESH